MAAPVFDSGTTTPPFACPDAARCSATFAERRQRNLPRDLVTGGSGRCAAQKPGVTDALLSAMIGDVDHDRCTAWWDTRLRQRPFRTTAPFRVISRAATQ
jgi:hypothetical protein